MNNSWKDCVQSGASRTVTPDKAKAKSLIDTASGRNTFLASNKVEESTANYIFEGYYSSLLELCHAIVLLKGFKVTNHICIGHYIRDELKNPKWYRIFDDCRYKRNSLIYYGRKMDYTTAKNAIENCQKLIREISKHLKQELK